MAALDTFGMSAPSLARANTFAMVKVTTCQVALIGDKRRNRCMLCDNLPTLHNTQDTPVPLVNTRGSNV